MDMVWGTIEHCSYVPHSAVLKSNPHTNKKHNLLLQKKKRIRRKTFVIALEDCFIT